ncbi:hypothetical protein FE257_000135 [Aspergillus nanangensis]|uniref:Molybdopterin synthase sulfur carrier subunit n=1 Tax=Aspergillus nanangensis TaxID=2582783 RepID=A0AAD4D0K7_ASPNN|nr:hypothetical protein FE257_000135 [Aspergillus nanangensis]
MPTPILDQLPIETLDLIATYIPHNKDRKALRVTCHVLNEVMVPKVFEGIYVGVSDFLSRERDNLAIHISSISFDLPPFQTLSHILNIGNHHANAMDTKGFFQVHYFSSASTYTGKQSESLPAPLPLTQLFSVLESKYPGIRAKVLSSCGISLGEEYVDVEDESAEKVTINPGDEIAIIPPVSSG